MSFPTSWPQRRRCAGPSVRRLHLDTGRPCIEAGSDYTWIVAGTLDLAGNDRKVYGGIAGSKADPIVDMGAYEVAEPPAAGAMFIVR